MGREEGRWVGKSYAELGPGSVTPPCRWRLGERSRAAGEEPQSDRAARGIDALEFGGAQHGHSAAATLGGAECYWARAIGLSEWLVPVRNGSAA
jgi:hypothetical protein